MPRVFLLEEMRPKTDQVSYCLQGQATSLACKPSLWWADEDRLLGMKLFRYHADKDVIRYAMILQTVHFLEMTQPNVLMEIRLGHAMLAASQLTCSSLSNCWQA